MNTDDIIRKLEQLNALSSELDTPEPQRNEMLNQVADYANVFINGLSDIKGYREKQTVRHPYCYIGFPNQKGND